MITFCCHIYISIVEKLYLLHFVYVDGLFFNKFSTISITLYGVNY